MIRIFSVFIPSSILGLLISETLLVAACFLLPLAWQMEPIGLYLEFENGAERLALVTLSMIVGLYLNDLYKSVRLDSVLVFLQQLCLVVGGAFLLQALLSYAHVQAQMPRTSMMLGSMACVVLIPLWRKVYSRIALAILGAEKVVFLGTHPLQLKIADYLVANRELQMNPAGFFIENEAARASVGRHRVLGLLSEAPPASSKKEFDRAVVGVATDSPGDAMKQILQFQHMGRRIEAMAQTYETVFGRVAISQLRPMDILFSDHFVPSPFFLVVQSIYSRALAFLGLLVTTPIMLLTAIAIKLTSKGPVLYRQIRTGKDNVPFQLLKFRSMFVDAEELTGAVWAKENDPRVTPIGRFIRKYRIDEFPQFINVLRGDMTLVGPRPERPEFVETLAAQVPFYAQRHVIRPGITGLAQISYRYGNTLEDSVVKLEYDLYYVKNLSPQLDLFIMFHTLKTMLLTTGAY
jgi:exopolysaccharide biosynthesis polyprenyl glycosylphosphotransferase